MIHQQNCLSLVLVLCMSLLADKRYLSKTYKSVKEHNNNVIEKTLEVIIVAF